MNDRQLIADLLSALEYHEEQTRPIYSTTVAIQAAEEYLRSAPQPVTLTDEEIDAVTISQWGEMKGAPLQAHRAYARAVIAAYRVKQEGKV